jgi:hypothetical protein
MYSPHVLPRIELIFITTSVPIQYLPLPRRPSSWMQPTSLLLPTHPRLPRRRPRWLHGRLASLQRLQRTHLLAPHPLFDKPIHDVGRSYTLKLGQQRILIHRCLPLLPGSQPYEQQPLFGARAHPPRQRSSASSARSVSFNSHPAHRRTIVPEPPAPADLGVLSTYPLRQPSAQCKANGGGVWQPRQSPTSRCWFVWIHL